MTPRPLLKASTGDAALRLEPGEDSYLNADDFLGAPTPAGPRPDREFGGDECATLNFLKSSAPLKDWQALLHDERTLTARLLRVTEARGRLEIHLRAAGHDVDALRCERTQTREA
jgi:hypothetical protein